MTLQYVLIAVLVFFSAFFSSSEIAYTSVNKMRLEKLAEEGKRTAKLALYITNHYERMLSGILIGNNLVNIAASSVSTIIVLALLGDKIGTGPSGTVATLAITVIILIFGEIAPKMYAKQKSLSFACLVAYPIFFIMMLFLPITAVVTGIVNLLSRLWKPKEEIPTVTEEELQSIIETAEEEEVLDEESSELLQSALSFPDTTVEDILVHRTNVKMLDIDDPYEENLKEIMESRHSRLLVYEDTVDHVIGILPLNRFFKALASVENSEVDIRAQLLEPCYVHQTLKLPAALSAMRRAKMQIAVVLDEYGGTLGIVTVEDILEELVGDIYDEFDDISDTIVETDESSFDVDGLTPIYDFFDHIDFNERDFDSEYTTMGGWATEMLDAEPHVGDSFTYENLYVIVTEMNDNIVSKLTVQVKEETVDEDEE